MILSTARRLLARNWTRLSLTFASLLVAGGAFAAILGIVGSVTDFFHAESKTLIGGDVSIRANAPVLRSSALEDLERQGVVFAERTEALVTVSVSAENGDPATVRTAIASAKIVSGTYPLYGALVFEHGSVGVPGPEAIDLAPALAARLGALPGTTVRIGGAQYVVRDILVSEPDVFGGDFRLAPPALLSTEGWERAGIDKRASRASYALLARYPATWSSDEARAAGATIETDASARNLRTTFATEGPRRLLRGLETAERFFFAIIVLSLVLAIVNIRINLLYLLASLSRTVAIFRALGMTRRDVLLIFATILFVVGSAAGIAGTLAGNAAADAMLALGETYIERPLAPPHPFEHLPLVAGTTILFCLVSALGFFAKLFAIAPKHLLGGYASTRESVRQAAKETPYVAAALLFLFGVVWLLTESATIAAVSVFSVAGAFALVVGLASAAVGALWKRRFAFGIVLRSIANVMHFRRDVAASAIASLAIALGALSSIALIEANVLGNLAGEFREDAPNVYVLDLGTEDLPQVRAISGPSWRDFPIVRARFIERNGVPIQDQLEHEDPELGREFNLTDRADFIEGERVVAGRWHGTTGTREVSVERDFAERAKLTLGSTVVFLAQGARLEATVTSIREVESTSGLPFFFLVFSPDVFGDLPRSNFGYARMSETEIAVFQRTLAEVLPSATAIATTDIVRTVTAVFSLVAEGVVAAAIPALALGLLLVASMLALAARERANDILVFTALGASRDFLARIFRYETAITILAAGTVGIAIAFGAVAALNIWFFDFRGFYIAPEVFAGIGIILALGIASSALVVRRLSRTPPRELFRKQ